MKKIISVVFVAFFVLVSAQTELVFVYFKDKPNKAAFYNNPLSELSQKSLDRRIRLNIPLNDEDAPIEPSYIQNIKDLGYTVTDYSKWLNGVAVYATTAQIADIKTKPYVQTVERFIKHDAGGKTRSTKNNKYEEFENSIGKTNFNYGEGLSQINQINLRPLHLSNYTGAGITIAVIDTGFPTVNTGSVYQRIRNNGQIKGGYNFINKNTDIYSSSLSAHGSYCLGVIAAFVNNEYVGSAPDADFYLYATEDAYNEIPEEQLYWAEAAEDADRKGADLITSSLGYSEFDDSRYDLLYSDMNGTTSFIARAAEIASRKGIFVLAAAGNEAMKPWHYLLTPADNDHVFSIGAVTETGASSGFSSFGPNSAGVIKPDASARGTATVMGFNTGVTSGDGTSFATPLAAGGVACLLQALPTKPLAEIRDLLRNNSSLYPNSTDQMGFGILNFSQTLNNASLETSENAMQAEISVYPNPVSNEFTVKSTDEILAIELYDQLGRILQKFSKKTNSLAKFPKGIYYIKIITEKHQTFEKIIKK